MAWEKFAGLLAGLHVIVETDHKNHLYMYSASSMKVQSWRMWLQQYDYEIRHLPGKLNEPVDFLSRLFDSLNINNLFIDAPTTEQATKERQQGIIAPSTVLRGVESVASVPLCDDGNCDEWDNEGGLDEALFNACGVATARQLTGIAEFKNMSSQAEGPAEETSELVVESSRWEEEELEDEAAILGAHEGLLASEKEHLHSTYEKSFRLLQNEGWADPGEWIGHTLPASNTPLVGAILQGREPGNRCGIGLSAELGQRAADDARDPEENLLETQFRRVRTAKIHEMVKKKCEGCLLCNKIWSTRGSIEAAGGAIIRRRPWTEVAIELIVLDEADEDGNKNIVRIVDSFTRAVELYPVQTGDAETVAACLYDVYNRYGRPKRVRCDGAKAFVKSVVKRLNKLVGVAVHPILPYSPYQNGQVERYNQEVMRHLRTIILGNDGRHVLRAKRWGLHTSAVCRRLLNNTKNSDTGCTPNELLYGGFGDTEASLFMEDLVREEGEPEAGWKFAKELEDLQFEILKRSEEHQQKGFGSSSQAC
jgi:hypothetical protein